MKFFHSMVVSLFLLFQMVVIQGQTSLKQLNLDNGGYAVGFKYYELVDSTRTYQIRDKFNNDFVYRPIPASIWYPAKINTDNVKPLALLNYLEILTKEEEWPNLPNEYILQWFHYLWDTPANRGHLSEKSNAYLDAEAIPQKFPVIVYAPSYQASSIENFALCEFLASHGYVVISSPSRGTNTRWLEGGTKNMETQSRDVEFLLRAINTHKNIATDKIALMGFSFGGLSNAITVMKNKQVKALVSLDGTERYRYDILEKSPYFDLNRLNIPYVHFAQKEIPQNVLEEDKIPEELNHSYQLYDSLTYSDKYSYRFHDLSHAHFSSFGIMFGNRDKRQDKSDDKIMESYKHLSHHVLQFLDANLKNDANAISYIENSPGQNGFPESLITKKMEKADARPYTYRDFMDIAYQQNFNGLVPLYQKTVKEHPDFQIPEVVLNKLGLHLAFHPDTGAEGIKVFQLALHLYPDSANLYDSLGTSYFYNDDAKNASASFKKSLELDASNQHAIDKLKLLKE